MSRQIVLNPNLVSPKFVLRVESLRCLPREGVEGGLMSRRLAEQVH